MAPAHTKETRMYPDALYLLATQRNAEDIADAARARLAKEADRAESRINDLHSQPVPRPRYA
ncbi:hypothetical protein [Actinokineospora sp. UTMC 2448]|uniref:hypothetical protein n=1 Tax=Actinokineospora sp. UTMC 2448 TaxID=2268449 RepID=UPI0021640A5A|nr:hypothetical protein [Actinokineospora sp. UTMC 2448]UVS82621.1 hypothetical protein Actkin_06395 [Actinokineospora sp. UTMC 2448]